jgi:hypothetical protein
MGYSVNEVMEGWEWVFPFIGYAEGGGFHYWSQPVYLWTPKPPGLINASRWVKKEESTATPSFFLTPLCLEGETSFSLSFHLYYFFFFLAQPPVIISKDSAGETKEGEGGFQSFYIFFYPQGLGLGAWISMKWYTVGGKSQWFRNQKKLSQVPPLL